MYTNMGYQNYCLALTFILCFANYVNVAAESNCDNIEEDTFLNITVEKEQTQSLVLSKCVYETDTLFISCSLNSTDMPTVLTELPNTIHGLKLLFVDYWVSSQPSTSGLIDLRNISRFHDLSELVILNKFMMYYRPKQIIVDSGTFCHLKKLRRLVINIVLLPQDLKDVIQPLSSLQELDLCHTKEIGIENIESLLQYVNHTGIKSLLLVKFQTVGHDNFAPVVNVSQLLGRTFPALERLDLSYNGILRMYPSLAIFAPSLRILNVSNNFLIDSSNLPFFFETWTHHSIEEIYVNNQGYSQNPTLTNTANKISHSQLYTNTQNFHDPLFQRAVQCANNLTNGNFSMLLYNKTMFCDLINCIYPKFEGIMGCTTMPHLGDILDCNCIGWIKFPVGKKIRIIHADYLGLGKTNRERYSHHGKLCFTENVLSVFSFTYNYDWAERSTFFDDFNMLSGLTGVESVRKLFLQYNYLHDLKIINQRFPGVEETNLAGNYILMTNDLNICENVEMLRVVNISNNNLTFMSSMFFNNCFKIETVDISDNKLITLNTALRLTDMKKLKSFDLSKNKFNLLPFEITHQLNNIAEHQHSHNIQVMELDITENPLLCNCEFNSTEFIHWIQSTEVQIVDKHILTCSGIHGTAVLVYTLDLHKHKMICHPSNVITIRISVSCTLGVIAFFGFIVCLYRYRWTLKYYSIKVRHYCNKCNKQDEQANTDWKFDVFVSYCAEDRFWVHDVLMKKLEGKYKFKLCIHYRDFPAGAAIHDAIIECIGQSKNIIIVISDASLKSEWVKFELQVACNQSLKQNQDLIIIKMGEGKLKNLKKVNPLLDELMEHHTYLSWTDNTKIQDVFWMKILAHLFNDNGSNLCCVYGRQGISYTQLSDFTPATDIPEDTNSEANSLQ